jgi:EIN3-binding F-box protein
MALETDLATARMAKIRVTQWRCHQQLAAWGEPQPSRGMRQLPDTITPKLPTTGGQERPGRALALLEYLPDDLLLSILNRLSQAPDLARLANASKRMQEMAMHRKLWHKVEFHDDDRITPHVLHTIACRSPCMGALRLQSCKHVNDRAIYSVASACHSLKEIDVSDCPFVTFRALNVLLGTLGELRKLNASGCENNVDLGISRMLPNLREISISDCDIDDNTVVSVAKGCPNLIKLDISGSTQISNGGILALTDCPHLRSLSFGDIGGADGEQGDVNFESGSEADLHSTLTSIRDQHLHLLAINVSSLVDIEITGCCNLTGRSVVDLLLHCPLLAKLALRSCDSFTECHIPGVLQFGLQVLEIQNCGYLQDAALLSLSSRCPELVDVNVYGCFSLTDMALSLADYHSLQLLNIGVS